MKFSFGQSHHERIEIDVLRYERAAVGDYYDDNWLTVGIVVRAGGFNGSIAAAILAAELAEFASQLRSLCSTLSGLAEFNTIEEQLQLRLTGDGKGHIELRGDVADQPGIGNRLQFKLQFDQSQLSASLRELESIVSTFPVRST